MGRGGGGGGIGLTATERRIEIRHHENRRYHHMSDEQLICYEDQLSTQIRPDVSMFDNLAAVYHRFWIKYHSNRIKELEKLR